MESCAKRFALAVLFLCLLTGCAYSYVAPDGARHVVGLVHVTLPADEPLKPPAASLRTQVLGLSLTSGDVGAALAVGYSDVTYAFARTDTCTRWPIGAAGRKDSTERRSP